MNLFPLYLVTSRYKAIILMRCRLPRTDRAKRPPHQRPGNHQEDERGSIPVSEVGVV